jgi:ABC-2 type transport system permease protein
MKKFETIKNILFREVRLIITDRNLITVLLIAPIFYAFFYGSIYFNKSEVDVPIVIVDNDNSFLSNQLVRKLDAHQSISVYRKTKDFYEAKDEINKNEAFAILVIPKNFEADLKSGKGKELKLFLNSTRFLVSNDINKAVNEVILTLNAGIRFKYFQAQGYSYDQAKEMIEPIQTDIRSMFNFTESYGDFLIPAVLILILHQTLLIGLAESFAKERENKTMNELYQVSDFSIHKMIIGKGIFYLLLYFSYALFFFGVVFYVFKINFVGSIFSFSLATILMIISTTFLSILISSFFERKIIAIEYLALSSYPIFLISGYSWPEESLPYILKLFAWLIPFTPYSNAAIKITQMGASGSNILLILIHLFLLSIIYYTLALMRLKTLINNKKK